MTRQQVFLTSPARSKTARSQQRGSVESTLTPEVLSDILNQAVGRYAQSRRAEIPDFVKRTYGWKGAAGMVRLGGLAARAAGARRLGSRLGRFQVMLVTDVGREVLWRLHADLLVIPYRQDGRTSLADALFDELLADPRVIAHMDKVMKAVANEADKRVFQQRLNRVPADYIGARIPATDIAAAVMSAAAGYAAYQKVTPGMVSLSATVAASIAHTAAVSTFWAGSWAGGLYYALAGAPAASALLTAGVFAGLTVPAAALAALAGMVADPIQVSTGLHQRRLNRLIDTLEHNFTSGQEARLPLRSHYAARLTDLWDWTTMAYRLTRSGGGP